MATTRYTKDELWSRVRQLHNNGIAFHSVVQHSKYTIDSVDEINKTYTVKYKSKNTRSISLEDLYAAYQELYRLTQMPRDHLRKERNGIRIFGHTRYSHAPGATIYGILPALDDAIRVGKGGHLATPSISN